MILKKNCFLALDTDDTNKIVEYLKDKKKEVLAITPNAYEILKKNDFENVIIPYDLIKNIHEELALDNAEFRKKINQKSNSLFDESFKNIFTQSFSVTNFINKLLKKENFYY